MRVCLSPQPRLIPALPAGRGLHWGEKKFREEKRQTVVTHTAPPCKAPPSRPLCLSGLWRCLISIRWKGPLDRPGNRGLEKAMQLWASYLLHPWDWLCQIKYRAMFGTHLY